MKHRYILLLTLVLSVTTTSYAQFGIRGGVNMANEIHSFDNEAIHAAFQGDNLTGYQVGLVYELNKKNNG